MTSGDGQLFGDTPLAFRLTRFSNGRSGADERSKWFFAVSRNLGHDTLIEIEANVETLRQMQRYLERAIDTVTTDGKRLPVAERAE